MDYSFGNWIKRRRKALDLSQRELADSVGCSVSAIFKIEADERRPSRQIAELLAEQLQIPPEQRPQFLKVARREKMVDSLEQLPVPLEPFPPSPSLAQPAQLARPAPASPESNLPLPLTPLVGREHELSLVVQQLLEPHCRVLTLTGLGGVGKTRLALEAAGQLRDAFSGGVFFVPLAGVGEPGFILPAIGDALGFPFSGPDDPGDQLLHLLRDKEILLVLDNFEHLLPGVELLLRILQGAPQVKLLVTSREPLNLQAEWAFEVQGLPVPGGDAEHNLQTSSAALLFLQRARQARLGFEFTPAERPAVLRICQLVEGLPLGIEMAAAWVRALSCQQISVEIEQNLDFLKASARDLPERHNSLRAVLDYSWDLLSGPEKDVFRKLSVFRGGFSLEAAQEVAGAGLEEIASLLNKSLLKRTSEKRYDLHELVRQYAAVRLESDPQEQERTHEHYIGYYAGLLEGWLSPLRSPRQVEILGEMNAEMDNIRRAWDWMVNRKQLADIGRSLHSLWHFHEIRGRFQEAESLLGGAVDALQSDGGSEARLDPEDDIVF
jgi:predicted ATPase/transcriptional regulator with XRE-family HTH domain